MPDITYLELPPCPVLLVNIPSLTTGLLLTTTFLVVGLVSVIVTAKFTCCGLPAPDTVDTQDQLFV